MAMKKYPNVDAYIADQPAEQRKVLEKIRHTIIKAAPEAEESISYGMPGYKQNGVLVYFAVFKEHYSFFPTGRGVEKFKSKLKGYLTSKGTVRFPFGEPVPYTLISEIVKDRVKENKAKAVKKRPAAKARKKQ